MSELFWADQIAAQIIERSKKEGRIANVKCQQTPSGGKHIGNLNDVVRAYFPVKSLMEKNIECSFVHTTDDRDPLKDVPFKLPDINGNWHLSKDLIDMKPYLGMPLCRIPDPFGCCKSWSLHFTKVWMDGVYSLGMEPDLYSVNDLYEQGKFEPYIKMVFEKIDEAGKIVSKFQQTKEEGYISFDAICPSCGRLANIDSFDMKTKKVHFTCGGKSIKKKKTEGCGFEGEVLWSEGKLQWRFEWPALWGIFQTTYEPFGKDHAEGSWKSGIEIAKQIFEIEPPIPYVYEFFLVDSQKMSASVGNVYIVQDMLKIMEPEVFMYFYTKRPNRQRNLELKNIFMLVDDFESAERIYFGSKEKGVSEKDIENIKRSYVMTMKQVPEKQPIRIPYQFAALISQIGGEESVERAINLLKFTGHLKGDLGKKDLEAVDKRLTLARNWVMMHAPEETRIIINERPPLDLVRILSHEEKNAVGCLMKDIEKDLEEQDMQYAIFECAKKNNIEPKRFFQILYRIIINKDSGPRLGPFIIAVGKERVLKLLSDSL